MIKKIRNVLFALIATIILIFLAILEPNTIRNYYDWLDINVINKIFSVIHFMAIATLIGVLFLICILVSAFMVIIAWSILSAAVDFITETFKK